MRNCYFLTTRTTLPLHGKIFCFNFSKYSVLLIVNVSSLQGNIMLSSKFIKLNKMCLKVCNYKINKRFFSSMTFAIPFSSIKHFKKIQMNSVNLLMLRAAEIKSFISCCIEYFGKHLNVYFV